MDIFGDMTIKEGDMAVVVRDCCGSSLGRILKVSRVLFMQHPQWLRCQRCNREYANVPFAEVLKPHPSLENVPLFWLKKIDPPQISDGETTERDIPVREAA